MKRDMVISSLVSLGILGGIASFGHPTVNARIQTVVLKPQDPQPIIVPNDPKDPDDQDNADATPHRPIIDAPPVSPDIPRPDAGDRITQPVETAVDPNLFTNLGRIPTSWDSTGRSDTLRTYRTGELQRIPMRRVSVRPVYPREMLVDQVSGTVNLSFIVDRQGRVLDVRVVSSTNAAFEASAVSAVSHWRFTPGFRDGHAVNTRMEIPVTFTISDDDRPRE